MSSPLPGFPAYAPLPAPDVRALPVTLAAAVERAWRASEPTEIGSVRRAFRRALAALNAGDASAAVLLVYRWP